MRTPDTKPAASEQRSTAQLVWLLIGDVADLLEGGIDADSARWLLPVLESLCSVMDSEAEDDAASGYLEDVVTQFPNAYEQVVALHTIRRRLHSELRVFVHQLRQLVEPSSTDGGFDVNTARILKLRLMSWVEQMLTQHRRERELSQSVWYLELGFGD